MKYTYTLILCMLVGSLCSKAQSGSVTCAIRYSYDASGNRIQREYGCQQAPNPNDPVPYNDGSLLSSLSPNPTSGSLTGIFTEPVSAASVTVSNMSGVIILSQYFPQLISSFTINIAQAVPGNYLVTVAATNVTESYVITKF